MVRCRRVTGLVLLLLAGAAGCATPDRLLPEERIAEIEPRITHQREVREWLGAPDAVEIDAAGTTRWTWSRRGPAVSRGRLGRWLLAPLHFTLERYVLFPPPRDPLSGRIQDRLAIVFEADGRVRDLEYRRIPR